MNADDEGENASATSGKRVRLTGNALLACVQEFLAENAELTDKLKITKEVGKGRAFVYIIRCTLHERFMDVLRDQMITGHLQNQHDVTSLFLVVVLKGGTLDNINIRNAEGTEIDINYAGKSYELKTKKDIDVDGVPGFIKENFDAMIVNQDEKHLWWFVFMLKRADAKGKIGTGCIYHMYVIEVDAVGLDAGDRDGLTKEVMKLVQKVQKRVSEEDPSDKSETTPFVTVDNVWVVDRMREKLEATEEKLEATEEENAGLKERIAELERQLRDSKSKNS